MSPDFEGLAAELQRLSDIEEIKRLRATCFRCFDSDNLEELEGLLTEDFACRCIGGDYEHMSNSREEFLGMVENSFHSEIATQRNGHGSEIDRVSDGEASGIVCLRAPICS